MSEKREGEEGYIDNEELAREMAQAQVPTQEKIDEARKLVMGEDFLNQLGATSNEAGEAVKVNYEQTMKTANSMIIEAIQKGESVIKVSSDTSDMGNALYGALNYRLTKFDPKKNAFVPKSDRIIYGLQKGGHEIFVAWK